MFVQSEDLRYIGTVPEVFPEGMCNFTKFLFKKKLLLLLLFTVVVDVVVASGSRHFGHSANIGKNPSDPQVSLNSGLAPITK